MYAIVGSRPDLAYSLSVLGRYAAAPDSYHLAMAKKVLAYVKATLDFKMIYRKRRSDSSTLTATIMDYVDSDFANSEDRKSITGFCFYLKGNLISWCSKKQSTVATSTTVAELIALYKVTIEAIYMRKLLRGVYLPQTHPTTIKQDNQTAIKLTDKEFSHKCTKYLEVKYYYFRKQQEKGEIYIEYIPTAENVADFFIKTLPKEPFLKFSKQLELFSSSDPKL